MEPHHVFGLALGCFMAGIGVTDIRSRPMFVGLAVALVIWFTLRLTGVL